MKAKIDWLVEDEGAKNTINLNNNVNSGFVVKLDRDMNLKN